MAVEKICELDKCTGCFACMNICPRSAISVGNGYLDKTIPVIDDAKCVECGICQSVCPVNYPVVKHKAEYSIAAWSKNEEDIAYSSSGGIASAFSRAVLRQNGIVFGTAEEETRVHVISISNENEIEKLRGSKYVQSEVGLAYREIKENLDCGKKVLFISTPCQVAGLKSFLKNDYENLITVDLICHGVPPQKYLFDYLNDILPRKKPHIIEFRGKFDFMLTVYNERKHIIYQNKSSDDYYFGAFLDSIIFRDNCYECPYACPERCSDITIGDFWGLDRSTLQNKYSGKVSVVLPNTEKGAKLFEQCRDELVWEKRSMGEACNEQQGNLRHPSIPSEDRRKFEATYPQFGFYKTLSKYAELGKRIQKNKRTAAIRNSVPFRACRKAFRICKRFIKCQR